MRPGAALLAIGLFAPAAPGAPAARRVSAFDDRFAFTAYGHEEGLLDLNVECLLQDHAGFLWVGTDDGLFRFDGRQFQRATDPGGVLDCRIESLHETKDGALWAGTRIGLCRKEGERFVPVGRESGLPPSEIPYGCLTSDPKGTVWVGTARGLFVGNQSGFRLVPRPDGGEEDRITALFRDDDGTLLVARPGLLHRTDASGTTEIGASGGLPDGVVIDRILRDGAGSLWVRTLKSLWALPPGEARFERDDEGLPAASESGRLALGERGEILVPTVDGLARKRDGAWKLLGRREGLPGDTVTAALVDREGSLWIGMTGEGLARRLGQGAFTGGGEDAGLAHNVVWSIVRDPRPDGALWVGTEHGLTRLDARDGSIRIYREADGFSDPVQTLVATPDGTVWAGSWPGGVTRIGPERGTFRRVPIEGVEPATVRVGALYRSANGNLWAGTPQGLFRLSAGADAKGFVRIPIPGAKSETRLFAFAEDREGILWSAGEGGLYRLTGPSPRVFGSADGLRSQHLSSLVILADGSFAVGHRETPGADRVVVQGERLRVEPIEPPPGAPAAKVVFLGTDLSGGLWVGSGQGVSLYPKEGTPVHYGRADGLLSEDMDQGAFFADVDGTVWLGTSRGLVHYHPGTEEPRWPRPPVVLLQAWSGARSLDLAKPAVLARGEREFHASWAALTFVDSHRVRFRYRLAGLDDAFRETALTEARYLALPSGNYTFEVTAVSAAGLPSPRAAAFSFRVAKAWWEEWWARALAGLALAALVMGLVHVRTRNLARDRQRLEEAVVARSKELAAANRELSEASVTDLLTGLRNRRYFSASIDADVAAARRVFADPGGEPAPRNKDLLFFLVDIDRFKEVNDVFGHHAGDRVLVEVARRLQGVVRRSDTLIRWGGEELLIVSREAERHEAHVLAERALAAIAKEPFDLGDNRLLWRTCSVGWAPFPWLREHPDAVSYEDTLRLADRALYLAKTEGRHRAVGVLPLGTETGPPEKVAAALKDPVLTGDSATVRVIRSIGPDVPG